MDYGKLAYLKAEDIEQNLNKLSKNTLGVINYAVGESGLSVTIKGKGEIALMYSGNDSEATIILDDGEVMRGKGFLLGKAILDGETVVRVEGEHTSGNLMLFGVVSSITDGQKCAFAQNGNALAVTVCDKHSVYYYIADASDMEFRQVHVIGGKSADICAYKDGFLTAVIAADRSLNFYIMDVTGKITGGEGKGDGGDDVAITSADGYISVCLVRRGKAVCFELASLISPLANQSEIELYGRVKSVFFVRDSPLAELIVNTQDKVYIKRAFDRRKSEECISVLLTTEWEES